MGYPGIFWEQFFLKETRDNPTEEGKTVLTDGPKPVLMSFRSEPAASAPTNNGGISTKTLP